MYSGSIHRPQGCGTVAFRLCLGEGGILPRSLDAADFNRCYLVARGLTMAASSRRGTLDIGRTRSIKRETRRTRELGRLVGLLFPIANPSCWETVRAG